MPDDIGAQYPQPDVRGWLVFESLPNDLQLAEDSTQAADRDQPRRWPFRQGFDRPATSTERILLAHLGYDLPDELTTHVTYQSASVRNRSWPQLETPEV